jgi:hypothetical protein
LNEPRQTSCLAYHWSTATCFMSKVRVNYSDAECGLGRACEEQGTVERGEAPTSWLTHESQGLPVQANNLDRRRRKRRSIGSLYLKVKNLMIVSRRIITKSSKVSLSSSKGFSNTGRAKRISWNSAEWTCRQSHPG